MSCAYNNVLNQTKMHVVPASRLRYSLQNSLPLLSSVTVLRPAGPKSGPASQVPTLSKGSSGNISAGRRFRFMLCPI